MRTTCEQIGPPRPPLDTGGILRIHAWVLCGNEIISLGHGPHRSFQMGSDHPRCDMFCQEATWTRDAQVSRWIAKAPQDSRKVLPSENSVSPLVIRTAPSRPNVLIASGASNQNNIHVQTNPDGKRTWKARSALSAQNKSAIY